jgi:hypothetical protein
MRWCAATLIAVAGVLAIVASGCGRAQAFETFILEEHDKIIAEAPGCYAECRIIGPSRRTCTFKESNCRAVCTTLPECKLDSLRPMKVCAIMKTGPF